MIAADEIKNHPARRVWAFPTGAEASSGARVARRGSAAGIVLVGALTFIFGACASAPVDSPQQPEATSPSGTSVLDGVFTASQASRGERRFRQVCAACRRSSEFSGRRFTFRWGGQTAGDIYDYVSTTMPEDDPGSLSPREYARILAYLLSINGYPAGEEELLADASALQNVWIEKVPAR